VCPAKSTAVVPVNYAFKAKYSAKDFALLVAITL